MVRYYCDYCDTFLTHDSIVVRKQHNSGFKHKANVRSYYSRMLDVAAGIVPSTDPPPAPAPPFHPGGGGGSGGGGRGHFHLPWGKAGAPYQGPPGMVPPPPAFMGGGGPPPPGQFGGGGTLPPYPPGPYGPPR